jgi:hypothetical protein
VNTQQLKAAARRIHRSGLFKAALVVMLLAAQVFGTAHETDLAAHTGDQLCHVCVSLGSLGGANVAPDIVGLAPAPSHEAPEYFAARRSSRPLKHTFARGPPNAS